jgi:hypothetical protein
MAQQKLDRKDFQIAVKTGTDANVSKFQKEAVLGEQYYATDTNKLYIATSTAGVSDATVSSISATASGGGGAFTGVTLSNLSGSGYYFDDYMGTIAGGGNGSWGSSQYFSGSASTLAGKYKKYTAAANATMRSDINTALGISGSWMSSSYGSGSLYAVANNYVASSTTGPLYVFAGPSGASPTAITDGGTGLKYIPIIYGIDFSGGAGYGPAWGMTFVYNEGGNAEESYDVSGAYNSSYSPACYFWGSSSSTTQSSFSADGSDGNYYPPSSSGGMFYGDQA